MQTPTIGNARRTGDVLIEQSDQRLVVLRRARTLARLRAAGLSDMTLATLLPDVTAQVAHVARRSALPVALTIAD